MSGMKLREQAFFLEMGRTYSIQKNIQRLMILVVILRLKVCIVFRVFICTCFHSRKS
uniref:Uncharacterized protein LOC103426086 n=1 Tax=Rhizophora mucronata TaxID=61149 RepID=A0A2P2MMG2_RHIMU